MLVVITLPHFINNEVDAIVRLFDERGIDRLHIRKPGAELAQVDRLLSAIPARYYPQISIHDHHELALRYELGGIHLNSRCPEPPIGWRGILSTSCHTLDELRCVVKGTGLTQTVNPRMRPGVYEYVSLSPIFDSISKQGYRAAFSPDEIAQAQAEGIICHQVLALGGVTFDRLAEVEAMGFGGAMILGDAWR